MPFLLPNQHCQSTEGNYSIRIREKTLEFSSTVLPALSPYRVTSRSKISNNIRWLNGYFLCRTCRDLGTLYRPEVYDSDGLSTLNYTVISRRDMTLYTHILVNLPDKPSVAATCDAPWRMTLTLTLLVYLLLVSNAL